MFDDQCQQFCKMIRPKVVDHWPNKKIIMDIIMYKNKTFII